MYSHQPKNKKIAFIISLIQSQTTVWLFIDIDDSQNKSAYEEVISFYNGCENLTTHHCKTCDSNLCKFCIIDHYKNTEFTKNHEK